MKYVLFSILILAILSPIIIGFLIVKLTERERPKGIGKAIYDKSAEGIIEQRVKAERLSIFSPTPEIKNSNNKDLVTMENFLTSFKKKKRGRVKLEFWGATFVIFLVASREDLTFGIALSLLFSPIWLIFFWFHLRKLKRNKNKIILTKQHVKIDDYSSEVIPWKDVKQFALVYLPTVPTAHQVPLLAAEFFDNSKYRTIKGKLNSKAHSFLYGNTIPLTQLLEYRDSPKNIVRELNRQLKRRKNALN